jgi:hypothetical protein
MRDKLAFTFGCFIVLFVFFTMSDSSHGQSSRTAAVSLPTDSTVSIPSPDRRWVLIASPFPERTIVLMDRIEKRRTLIKKYDRSLQVGWSPDSKAFFFNDAYGSNLEDAFVYWVESKEPLLLNDLVLSHDNEASAVPADHAYFQVRRWQSATNLLVEYCGHGGEGQGQQFDFLYDVALKGLHGSSVTARRIARKIGPSDLSVADCRP